MQTSFTPEQLADPELRRADEILRKCVHCGFCMATCPTYLITGNELHAPRGRVYLIRTLLEDTTGAVARDAEVVRSLDACLTCFSCLTACPSGVDYDELIDIARHRLRDTPARDGAKRFFRRLLLRTVPEPKRLRTVLALARPLAGLSALLEKSPALKPAARMLRMARQARPARPLSGTFAPRGKARGRVAVLAGCAQAVLARRITEATVKILNAAGLEVVIPEQAGCCGAMELHLGERQAAQARAAANVRAWERAGVDAVIIDASGCAGTVKDYARLLAGSELAQPAARLAENAFELAEFLHQLPQGQKPVFQAPRPRRVVFHAPCSLTHHLRAADLPRRLLEEAGHEVMEAAENHLCCGAGGANAVLEPEVADTLRARKLQHLLGAEADIIATANFGCLRHLAQQSPRAIVHYAELLADALP